MRLRRSREWRNLAALVIAIFVVVGASMGCAWTTDADAEPAQPTTAQPASPLTLTLSAPEICETERAQGYAREGWSLDDDGVLRPNRPFWANVGEVPVRWQVRGGRGPYSLIVDNEARDGRGPYEGATGRASVSCAPVPGEVFYNDYDQDRYYRADPTIDCGIKLIRAAVTDADGAVAEASIEVYVILQLGGSGEIRMGEWRQHRLSAGKTYRFNGHLYTIPDGMTLVAGGGSHSIEVLHVEDTEAVIYVDAYDGEEEYRAFGSVIVWPGPVPQGVQHPDNLSSDDPDLRLVLEPEELLISALLDEFVSSLGEPPSLQEARR